MGVKVEKVEKGLYISSERHRFEIFGNRRFQKRASSLRGSIMIVGPLLTRFGAGYIPKPGGDKIGKTFRYPF